MNSATAVLRKEHDAILKMLEVLEATAARIREGETVPVERLNDLQEFFMLFADRCHHGKEEDLLFPLLESKGMPRVGGPVGCMLNEHDEGRRLVSEMGSFAGPCARGEQGAQKIWTRAACAYAELLRNHIWKENEILFQMAEQMLSAEEQAELFAAFERVEEEKMGAGTHARLHEKMEKLTEEATMKAK